MALLLAPSGFGKTTLVRQYLARQSGWRRSIWLTIDEGDNDVRRLFDRIESELISAFRTPSAANRSYTGLDRLEALIGAAGPLIIVLDEFEHLHAEPALRATRQLISRLPEECELVIASRRPPNIGVDRLRLQGEMVQIDTDDLRFTLSEVASLLRGIHGLQLTEAQLSTLHRRSEGWVGALHLFALSYDGKTPQANLLESFTGSAWQTGDSFVEAILERLAPDVRDFLIDSSVLGEFTAAICDEVMRREDSRILIDRLYRQGVFLERLEGPEDVWRYHALFAGLLRSHATPERNAAVRRRAADVYLRAQRPARAIDHLLSAGDISAAGRLIAVHARSMLADGRIRLLQRWFEQLPPHEIRQHDELRVVYAWTLALSRRFVETNMLVEPLLADAASSFHHEARTIRSLCLWMADRMNDCFDEARMAVAGTRPGAPLLGGILANILAHCHIATNRFDEARSVLSQALFTGSEHRHGTFSRIIADTDEAVIDLIQGRLGNALTRLRKSTPELVGSRRLSVRRGIMVSETILAIALYERGDVLAAEQTLLDLMPYSIEHGTPDLIVDAHLLASRIACANGDDGRALAYLDELEQAGSATGLPRLGASAWIGRSWLAWRTGRFATAHDSLSRASAPSLWRDAGAYVPHVTDFDSIELMRLRLDIERDASNAAVLASQEIARANAGGRHRRAMGLRTLYALALARSGRQEQALEAIGDALVIASREGHVRLFLDENAQLQDLVRQWLADHPPATGASSDPFLNGLREMLLRQLGPSEELPPEPLSPRELEVLQVLARGLRNHEIAERLALSETTVRTHLRSINQKLRASSRTDAVAIARRCGLVE
ncbi:MAG: LuxR C-terminal-related transcriptional regulator [Pseudoxanthomonas sp.]